MGEPSNMPIIRPLPIPTKGKESITRVKNWLTYIREWEIISPYRLHIDSLDIDVLIPGNFLSSNQVYYVWGFIFDGASIPKIFSNILAPTGILFIPGLIHDFGYKYQCLLALDGTPIFVGESQKFFDDLFHDLSIQINGMVVPSKIAWVALRGFGFLAWNHYRKLDMKPQNIFPHLYETEICVS